MTRVVVVSPDNVTHVYYNQGRTMCGRSTDENWTIAYPIPEKIECHVCDKSAK